MTKSPICQRRHYDFFASAIRVERIKARAITGIMEKACFTEALDQMTDTLSTMLAKDNPNFRSEQFEAATQP